MDHSVEHTVPFCERNTKLWVTLLVASGVLVLGYSLVLAWERGQFSGFGVKQHRGPVAGAGGPQGPRGLHPGPGSGGPPGVQVAQAVPAAAPGAIDAVTHATPHGGIKFMGGTGAVDLQAAFNTAADIIRPSVVNISATQLGLPARVPGGGNGARFLEPFDGVPDKVIGQAAYENVGSGVIVHSAGYVVTNNHVIEGATSVVVSRYGRAGEQVSAQVVAADRESDLALLRLAPGHRYPAATLGDSSVVEVGDWVLAVGNPFGLEHTVTAGIVSARRSSLLVEGVEYHGLLQTDAPINRGSSGGPLANLDGQIIGINTAIWAPNGVFSGAGFAIPSNRVRAFVDGALRGNGVAVGLAQPGVHPSGPYVGVGVIDVTPDLAAKLKYPHRVGVYVSSVVLDSPADEAELTRGDIIVSLGGQPVTNRAALRALLASLAAGTQVPVTVWRAGKTERLRMTVAAGRPAGQ